ncbi:hypothetical protein KR093_001217 [Drosophila rubida]|uniref:Uncharacterized protein n=1 Tax=Drosophila rubida TaxID=30044 RepID=A0AAD4JTQ7_9MUSC|nr:hypothetical protein KR093_001217 [Drosophila rubida]
MNPSCVKDIDSAECQNWISEVLAFCNRLLAAKQHEFWNDWWLNGQPVAYYRLPHLKSLDDCQKLKKDIAQQLSELSLSTRPAQMEEERVEPAWQTALILFVACLALIIIMSMIWLLNNTLRRIAEPKLRNNECEGFYRRKKRCGTPRSFISFVKPFHPMARYGPYRSKSIFVPRDYCTGFRR